jgi:hypothetical protein
MRRIQNHSSRQAADTAQPGAAGDPDGTKRPQRGALGKLPVVQSRSTSAARMPPPANSGATPPGTFTHGDVRTIGRFTVEARDPSFYGKVDHALSFINEGPTGRSLLARIDRAQALGKTVTIREADLSLTRPAGRAASASGPALSDAQANKAAQKRSFGRKGAGSDAVIDWNADEKGSYTRLGRELVHAKRITTGTYTAGPESGDLADPSSKAAQEDQRAVGVGKYAGKTPSANSIRKEHGLALHADTSTSTTAAAALTSPDTAPPGIAIESIRTLVFENEEIKHLMRDPKDNCADCAKEVRRLLRHHVPPIPSAARGIAMWEGADQGYPTNHIVVVVNIAGQEWIIDPTAHQFDKGVAMFEPLAVWKEAMCRSIGGQAAKWIDAASVDKAASNTMFGSAKDFEGEVLAAPEWYRQTIGQD